MEQKQVSIKYFTYGSNMDKDDLDRWCCERGHAKVEYLNLPTLAKLEHYRLAFNYYSQGRGGAAANIMESKGSVVYGILVDITENDLNTIRKKEGCCEGSRCCYEEIRVAVEVNDGEVIKNVRTYKVVKEKEVHCPEEPTKKYMKLIISSAQKYSFPEDYIDSLKSIKTKQGC